MKKFWVQVIFLLLSLFVVIFFLFENGKLRGSASTTVKQVKINDTLINVELADNPSTRAKGLGDRDSLDLNSGMLFVFNDLGNYHFWMKDMRFPLDIIWIKGDTITNVMPSIPNPPPGTDDSKLAIYGVESQVDKVLELNAGFAASHNIQQGDKVEFVD